MKTFSFEGREYSRFDVESVYDGDTCTLTFYHEDDADPIFKKGAKVTCKCRLLNINAAEMRPGKHENREDIVAMARKARDYLASILADGSGMTVSCGPYDKYGRVLVTIKREDGLVINDMMISSGHAVVYSL